MTERVTHDSAEQLLPAAALEILEGEELIRVTAHARDCAECSRQIDSYREVLSRMALTLPLQSRDPTRSARLRARLLQRAGGPSAPRNIQPHGHQRFTGVIGPWAGWALAAGLAGVLLVHHSVHRPVAYGWLVAGILTFLVLALAVYVRHLRTRLLAMNERNSDSETGRDDRSPPFP